MKLTIKPKAEKTDQYNMRMPVSLKQRLTTLATRASSRGVDLNATQVAMMEQLAAELEERFDAEDKVASTNPNKVLGRPTSDTASGPTASAITAGSDSIAEPVSQHAKQAPESITKSTTSNGAEPERA